MTDQQAEAHRWANSALLAVILTGWITDGIVFGFWGILLRLLVFIALLSAMVIGVEVFIREAAAGDRAVSPAGGVLLLAAISVLWTIFVLAVVVGG